MITPPLSNSKDDYTRAACNNPAEVAQLIVRRSPFAALGSVNTDSFSSSYASSMDNISKLLNGFMKSSPPHNGAADIKPLDIEVNPLLSFDHMSGGSLPAAADVPQHQPPLVGVDAGYDESKQQQAPLSPIEKWLFDEAAEQVVDLMDLSDGCCSVPMLF